MRFHSACLLLILFLCANPSTAQEENIQPITLDNATNVQEIGVLGRGTANALDWHPDGKVLAVGSSSGVWLLNEELAIIEATPIRQPIVDVVWSPDGSRIAVVSNLRNRCTVQVWDAEFEKQQLKLDKCGSDALWNADGSYLAVFASDFYLGNNDVVLIETATGEVTLLPGQDGAWSPSGDVLFTRLSTSRTYYDDPPVIHRWDVHTKAALFTLDITDSQFGTILWASDDHTLVVDCYESEPDSDSDTVGLCSFDAQTGSTKFLHEITTYPKGNAPHLIHSAWNRKETLLASVNESFTRGFLSAVMVFDVGTNALIYIGEGQIFDWKPNTDTLTAVIGNGEIRTYDTKNREVLAESQWFTAPINDIAIRPSDDQIASTGFGYWQDTHVWDLSESTLDPLLSFRAEPAEIVDYTPDGSQLIAGGTITTDIVVNQQIDSFDADTGKRLRDIASYYQQGGYAPSFIWNADYTAELSSPHNIVYSPETFPAHISWSRDYSMISIVEQSIQDIDFKIGLWDAATGKLLNRFDDGMFAFKDLIWSPTGTHFAITLEHTTGSGVYVRSVHVFKAEVYEGEADDFYIQTPPVYEIDTDVDIFESNQQARVAWNHDGTLLAVILPDRLEIHDLAGDGTPLVTLPAYGIVDLEWSSDDRFIAGGSEDGLIYLWGVP